jgi:hypothetical protein
VIDRAFAREKKKDIFIQDALAEPSPRGLTHCRWNLAHVSEFGGLERANVCHLVL